ncbi:uncharacterized protein ARMOST_20871 [Armillaria ostoyae]|uniref:Uncharacterized protein n=1 Tax=Armillaria ostoyae TaxID=47428 RepID=A0A284S8I5_ARMOS|nr:uncharacterized protein ARMOST_20871 [Armillaria ostoyae]
MWISSSDPGTPTTANFQPAPILLYINASSSTGGLLKQRILELEEEVRVEGSLKSNIGDCSSRWDIMCPFPCDVAL